MDQVNQGESSGVPSTQVGKRKRGRPCKDTSAKRAQLAPAPPPVFVAPKQDLPQIADHRAAEIDPMVGQAVTGVVEGTLNGAYLLSVKIADSNLRGVVFPQGHHVPIHVPPAKRRKYARRKTGGPSAPPPPVVESGKLVPVVLQPINFSNGLLQNLENGDKDVKVAGPLSKLPTMGNDGSCNEGTISKVEVGENVISEIHTPCGSAQAKEIKIENGKEGLVLEQGSGVMTELLEGSTKEKKVKIADQGEALESKVEFHEETATDAADQKKAP